MTGGWTTQLEQSMSDLVCCPVILLRKSGANTVWEMLKEPPVCFGEHAGWPACPGRKEVLTLAMRAPVLTPAAVLVLVTPAPTSPSLSNCSRG